MSDSRLFYRPVDTRQLDVVAGNMHPIDVIEINATHPAGMRDPRYILDLSIALSDFTVAGYNSLGGMVLLFGVAPLSLTSDTARPWLLRRLDAPNYKRAYVIDSAKYIEVMAGKYRLLENWISADNRDSMRWLKRNRFVIEQPLTAGFNGEKLCRFYRDKDNVQRNTGGHGGRGGNISVLG